MAQEIERGGGGEKRKETSFPSHCPLFHFFCSRSIFRAAKTENPFPRSFFAPKPDGNALATQANQDGGFIKLSI